jgi:fatty acid-binding protein DegV
MSLEKANELARVLSAEYPEVPILRSTISPVLGVYSGPNALAVTVLEERR